jgi:hypothetical protein
MSANAEALRGGSEAISSLRETVLPQATNASETNIWNAEDFAREQIRGLVRRVFFATEVRPVKQVVFSAAEPHLDVAFICEQVARALAAETSSQVALVSQRQGLEEVAHLGAHFHGFAPIKSWATQIGLNLWRVPKGGLGDRSKESGTGLRWLSCLAELRNEFEYAVIHGPAAAISSEAALLGQMTDGIILILGAHSTRRATARKIKETLEGAQSRILGTVLSERTFPMPERIYRRL